MKRASLSAVLFIALFAQWSFAAPSSKLCRLYY